VPDAAATRAGTEQPLQSRSLKHYDDMHPVKWLHTAGAFQFQKNTMGLFAAALHELLSLLLLTD
jgi:hypothetical protein